MKFTKKATKIVISGTNNGGFVVKVGCCAMAYGDSQTMMADLAMYLGNMDEAEKQYNEVIGCIVAVP